MSLLLEALKKAERNKLGKKEQTERVQNIAVVENTAATSVSDYPSGGELELVPENTSSSKDVPKQQTDHVSTQNRIAAQNIFSAKQNKIKGIRIGRASKWAIFSGVVLITMMGGAYYVWKETTFTSEIAFQPNELRPGPTRQRSEPPQVPSQAKTSVLPESNLVMAPIAQAPISSIHLHLYLLLSWRGLLCCPQVKSGKINKTEPLQILPLLSNLLVFSTAQVRIKFPRN